MCLRQGTGTCHVHTLLPRSSSTFLSHVPWLGVNLGNIPAVVEPINILMRRCQELAKARLSRGSEKHDLFHYLVSSLCFLILSSLIRDVQNHEDTPDRAPPPVSQLVEDGILAMVAGADTVASALTSIFACLLGNQEAYNLLEKEVDKFYPPGSDALDTRFHRDMEYLIAVMCVYMLVCKRKGRRLTMCEQ